MTPAPKTVSEDLEDLYENAPCGYMSLNPDGRIVKSNATLSVWTGFSQEELRGKKLHDLLNIGGRIFFETHFAPLLRMQGFFHEVALDFITKDGSKIPALTNATERRDDNGNLLFTRITIFKAADRRRYERELVEMRAIAETARNNLEAANSKLEENLLREREVAELREQFIAILGHDLRNPVQAFGGGIRMLRKENLSTKGERWLDLLQGSVLRMSGLIDNILDFARGRLGGGIGLNIDNTPLQPILEQVAGELRATWPDAVIETNFLIATPVPCDRMRIGQMTSNLLANALTHGDRSHAIRIHAETNPEEFILWIANAGEPIPEVAMQRLFHPFFRGEVRPSQEGLGLGLHIASEIAKAHGGTLTVESSETETRFTFRMPLTQSFNPISVH
jgi:sigma-B regulation protein RsbU (phosphoserine phosphatase)